MNTPAEPPRKNFVRQVLGQWPLALVMLGVGTGLAIVATSHWRLGTTAIGVSFVLGGVLRLLPKQRPGLLAVRSRWLDCLVLLGLGVGILVLAWLVPPSRP